MPPSHSLLGRRRLQMNFGPMGIPEVPMLGRYNYIRAEQALPEHAHGDILEICFLVKGRQTYRVGGRDYHLRGGDLFVAFPQERHSSAGNPQEKGILYWMMLRKAGRVFLGLPPKEAAGFWKALCNLSLRHFRGSWEIKRQLDSLTVLFNGADSALRSTAMISGTLSFLLEVLKCAKSGRGERETSRRLDPVYRHIQQHLDEPLSVPHMAEKAGLSVARFKARFKEETGLPPGEFVLRARIDEAKERLVKGGVSVTDIAYGLGFSSSQYFATVFKRFSGETPSAFLQTKPAKRKFRAKRS